jgi:thiosulfate dehydrogenase
VGFFLACAPTEQKQTLWVAPDTTNLTAKDSLIRYGRDLIIRTSYYLGPQGTVAQISNGMNCQNCHLKGGTVPFGNNYGSVASLYPRFRDRSGGLESIEKRVNDCIERSLGGSPIDSLSAEMRALVAYFHWLGKDVPSQKRAEGSGLYPLPYLPRAADTLRGKIAFQTKCESCHLKSGQGVRHPAKAEFVYPPLWGDSSFTTAAGLYRISNFARFVYANMPQGATFERPLLTPEEAWDIAAYVLSQPRRQKTFPQDWPRLGTKPLDHPFGPYIDEFPETQHKYGPFPPIENFYKSLTK